MLSSSSDGMSRSGVFITCMSEIERVKVEGGVDIFPTVKTARVQRPHMVASHVSRETSMDKLQCNVNIKWFSTGEICDNCNVTSKSVFLHKILKKHTHTDLGYISSWLAI